MNTKQFYNMLAGYFFLISIWIMAYKSAAVFGFFETYASLWFLPAGVTFTTILCVPKKYFLAPLIANLLLVSPQIATLLHIEWTNYRDPLIHSFRLYLLYGGAAYFLRRYVQIKLPISSLKDSYWVLGISLITAIMAGISGIAMHVAVGNMDGQMARSIAIGWIVGDAIGVLFVPIMLAQIFMSIFFNGSTRFSYAPPVKTIIYLLVQFVVIFLIIVTTFFISNAIHELSLLWVLIIIPVIFLALHKGVKAVSPAVFFTIMLAPPIAHFIGFAGHRENLQLLLLAVCLAALTIGAAITDRQNAINKLQEHENELEHLVFRRTEELEHAYGFQKYFIQTLGHDLRQPLIALDLVLDGLIQSSKGSKNEQFLTHAKKISASASSLISKVLDYAKKDAAKLVVEKNRVELSDVFETLELVYRPQAESRNIELVFNANSHYLETDKVLLVEALSNLVDNSIKNSDQNTTVSVSTKLTDSNLAIEVIDENEMYDTPLENRGLGLEIVRKTAEFIEAKYVRTSNCSELIFRL